MTAAEKLIAQAEALEQFAEQIDVDPDAVTSRMLSIAMKQTARTYRMNAQAEQPAEPVAVVYVRQQVSPLEHGRWVSWLRNPSGIPNDTNLYLRPDPRIAALEGLTDEVALIRSVLNGYPQSMARADALRAVERIEAALGGSK